MWIHTNGDIRKVAACKVKPYELVYRESKEYKQQVDQDTKLGKKNSKKVMLEDGLKDVEDLLDPEEEERKDALKINDALEQPSCNPEPLIEMFLCPLPPISESPE